MEELLVGTTTLPGTAAAASLGKCLNQLCFCCKGKECVIFGDNALMDG